ncbi:hypothetical protein Pint_03164 [Pistacia integerrima]|uniref:Uncharacterized protein n=1 Tax=Pistacia integerrima TaxID=434235 RepID=A0ACC0ZK01_9ROSI|nr:hypothetical protein Pint_03164 [Pistacia integerrima]
MALQDRLESRWDRHVYFISITWYVLPTEAYFVWHLR